MVISQWVTVPLASFSLELELALARHFLDPMLQQPDGPDEQATIRFGAENVPVPMIEQVLVDFLPRHLLTHLSIRAILAWHTLKKIPILEKLVANRSLKKTIKILDCLDFVEVIRELLAD